MSAHQILPGTGRGTVRRTVEGGLGIHCALWTGIAPSTMLRMVPIPVSGRI